VNDLVRLAPDGGFQVGVLDPILLQGARISSSRIRQLIQEGRVDEVRPMMGRYHFVSGRVVTGHHRGRDLGFPTANISSPTEVIPLNGIYASLIQIKAAMAERLNIVLTLLSAMGRTMSFVPDFDSDIWRGRSSSRCERIREERKFVMVKDLVTKCTKMWIMQKLSLGTSAG
jgi:FAD synthase